MFQQYFHIKPSEVTKAVAKLYGDGVSGLIWFEQTKKESPVKIYGNISGLTYGLHGLHIHEFGDNSEGCVSMGNHWNPFNETHGGPKSLHRHAGDLGNVLTKSNGITAFEMTDKLLSLYGEHSIIGRSVVVHQYEDDLGKGVFSDSLTTGHSGPRLACGVIGISK